MGAHFQQIVKRPSNHVALLNLDQRLNRVIECRQRLFRGVRQLYFDKGNLFNPQLCRVQHRAKSANVSVRLQPLHPNLTGAFGQINPLGQISDRQPAFFAEQPKYLDIISI